jgi:hypothetical protein
MLDKALGDDPRHHLSSVVLPFSAIEAQREREGLGEVIRRGGREAILAVDHAGDRSAAKRTRQERVVRRAAQKHFGAQETDVNIRNEISWGGFSAVLFVQCLMVIGAYTIHLHTS